MSRMEKPPQNKRNMPVNSNDSDETSGISSQNLSEDDQLVLETVMADYLEKLDAGNNPDPAAYADVLTIGYDSKGTVNGQVEFYKSILSPGEAEMYMGMVYPAEINGKKVPENMVGKPIFRLSDKLAGDTAAGQTFFDGPLGGDDGAKKESLNMLSFIMQGANTASEVLSIGDKNIEYTGEARTHTELIRFLETKLLEYGVSYK